MNILPSLPAAASRGGALAAWVIMLMTPPEPRSTSLMSNADQFVGWGQVGIASEFSLRGALTFSLSLPPLVESYRAYRFPWSAQPLTPPVLGASRVTGATSTESEPTNTPAPMRVRCLEKPS